MLFPRIKVLRFRLFVLILCAAMLCQSRSYLWFTNSSFKCHSHFISLCHQYFQPPGLVINPRRRCRLLAHAPRFSFPDPFLLAKRENRVTSPQASRKRVPRPPARRSVQFLGPLVVNAIFLDGISAFPRCCGETCAAAASSWQSRGCVWTTRSLSQRVQRKRRRRLPREPAVPRDSPGKAGAGLARHPSPEPALSAGAALAGTRPGRPAAPSTPVGITAVFIRRRPIFLAILSQAGGGNKPSKHVFPSFLCGRLLKLLLYLAMGRLVNFSDDIRE